ncbi:MAG TPA: hypothetical protein DEF63_00775, partial [Cyanobacteria bacterium UBA11440]|nr:hypothetical protein [Cyanobacteria bacterium UBA11440]
MELRMTNYIKNSFLVLLLLVLLNCAAIAKTVTVKDDIGFQQALRNDKVNSIIIKTTKYNPKLTYITGYDFNKDSIWNNGYVLDKNLSISGSVNPLGDMNETALALVLYNTVDLTKYNLSLKNISVSNFSEEINFNDAPFFMVGVGHKLTLNNASLQTYLSDNFHGNMIENKGIIDLYSARLIGFNEAQTKDERLYNIKNNGTVNFKSGKNIVYNGITADDGKGTTNISGGKVIFDCDAGLKQETVKISKGMININPENVEVNNFINNAKNGIVFTYDEMEQDETLGKEFFTKNSLSDVTLRNTNISGKGSIRIEANVVVDDSSNISQTIYLPSLVKLTRESVTTKVLMFYYNVYDKKGNLVGADKRSDELVNYDKNKYVFKQVLITEDESGKKYDIPLKKVEYVEKTFTTTKRNRANSLTSNADNIKGVVNNNAVLNLTGGTITKKIVGKGQTNIVGEVKNESKFENSFLAIDTTASFITNANLIKRGTNIFNNGEIHLTGGSFIVGLMGRGDLYIDGNVGNKSKLDEGSLVISEKANFVTNASKLGYYFPEQEGEEVYGIRTLANKGTLILTGGSLTTVYAVSNTGKIDDCDVTKGLVYISGKVKFLPFTYLGYDDDYNEVQKIYTPKVYQWIDISKKGNLTANADTLKGNVVNIGNLNLNGGILDIDYSDTRDFAVQNQNKMNVTTTMIQSDIDNFGTLNIKDSIIGTTDDETSVSTNDSELIWNTKTLNISSSKNNQTVFSNIQGLTLLNTASSDISLNGKKYKSLVGKATFTGNILFKLNNATGNGGVIANILNGTNYIPVVIMIGKNIGDNDALRSEFNSNTAINGGTIYNEGNFTVKQYRFDNNSANLGGAIYNESGTFNLSNSVFNNNTAEMSGGAIYNNYERYNPDNSKKLFDRFNVSNSTFNKNVAKSFGGAINNYGVMTIKNSVFNENQAEYGGGVSNSADMTISNSVFGSNKYTYYYHISSLNGETNPDVTVERLANTATYGAGFYNSGIAEVTKSTFLNNDATKNGGGIYNGFVLDVLYSDFHNNTAKENGGAIYSVDTSNSEYGNSPSSITIYKSNFYTNSAKENGGAVYLDKSSNTTEAKENIIDSSIFGTPYQLGNTANNGGAIYNSEYSKTKINASSFLNNKASDKGGDIYNAGVMTISNSYFGDFGSTIKNGYYVYSKGGLKRVTSVSKIDKNLNENLDYTYGQKIEKAISGGTIYNSGTGDLTIKKSTFKNAVAVKGGAIYNDGKTTVTGSTFTNNSAYASGGENKNGGAIYNGGNLTVSNTKFDKNSANNNGGAIYVAESTTTNIANSTFTNNSATNGGAIYVGQDSSVTITDSNFTNNTATNNGGAIYMDKNSTVTINAIKANVTFSGNKAGDNSNSIYMDNNSTLNLIANNKRKITIKDNIEVADNTAKIGIKTIGSGVVTIVNESALSDNIVTLENNSRTSLQNSKVGVTTFKSLEVNGTSRVSIDASLKSGQADKIQAETVSGDGRVVANSINIISNSKTPVDINVGKDSVISSVTTNKAESAEATYKLKSYYDENGMLRVLAYGQKAKPAAVSAPVAAQI